MKISDIRHASQSYILEVTCETKMQITKGTPIRLFQEGSSTIASMYEDNQLYRIKGVSKKYDEQLKMITGRNLPHLAEFLSSNGNGVFNIEIKVFAEREQFNIQIGVQDQFVKQIKRKLKLKTLQKPELDLTDMFLMKVGSEQYAIIGYHTHVNKVDLFKSFILTGKTGYLQIKRCVDEDGQVTFYADKIIDKVSKDYKFVLLRGELAFKNETELEKARLETLAYMEQLGNSIEAYMNIWKKYGEIEEQNIMMHAEDVGFVQYINWDSVGNGVTRFDIGDINKLYKLATNLSNEDRTLTFTDISPADLFIQGFTVDNYREFVKTSSFNKNYEIHESIDAKSGRIYVRTNFDTENLPQTGYIFLSVSGNISRLNRRNRAQEDIILANSGIPHLASILEGKSVSKPNRSFIEPISEKTAQKVFPVNPPTPKQKEAMEIALNTPDIALIQGPPGTGKTTVILGILERINEISDSSDQMFAKNLVTAFQHDAVQNVVDRLEILGLPSIKYGKKRGEAANDERLIEYTVDSWIGDKRYKLYEKYPNYTQNKYIKQFDHLHKSYLLSANTKDNTIRLLKEIAELLEMKLPIELLQQLQQIIRKLEMTSQRYSNAEHAYLIRRVYSIPVHPIAYEDNGANILREVVFRLKRRYEREFTKEINVIEQFQCQEKNEGAYTKLKAARKSLLVGLLPREEIFYTPKQNEEILDLLAKISDFLNDELLKTQSGEDLVLMDYIQQFEHNPFAIRNAVSNYISVIGATNQQSVGDVIINEKVRQGIISESERRKARILYDNVLIDEAARSNPLDLFIPMSRAKERIILVGDHRQLPHIVDEGIVRSIEKNVNADKSVSETIQDNIQKSMFEYLFNKLKELERADGIKRTITLDKQYRTHPLLGEFVSKNFYEYHGEVHIDSGLPAKYFSHQLQGLENKAAVWMNIPITEGTEVSARSKSRPIEAKRIVAHLKKMMDSEQAVGLNFGIITFYADQVEEIYTELVNQGMAVKEGRKYTILKEYAEEEVKGKKIEKLRIGTVDAFQGMEFDFVYLSMVRSNTFSDETEEDRRKKYGFLMVENRLCVSMSRQKKMLIVAGDKAMLQTTNANKAIRALVNYYQLCAEDVQYGKII
ncbi:DEAD/DEAH box helicase [Ectobacillus funiculus]|uniref:DEAD/DEAH box helicase n=1 Tax=Ectobacillus funiculus TaxID=137993 RepID=UPI00101C785B|nr:AAA domain-containing protein [Ectobacillus funiculus]